MHKKFDIDISTNGHIFGKASVVYSASEGILDVVLDDETLTRYFPVDAKSANYHFKTLFFDNNIVETTPENRHLFDKYGRFDGALALDVAIATAIKSRMYGRFDEDEADEDSFIDSNYEDRYADSIN